MNEGSRVEYSQPIPYYTRPMFQGRSPEIVDTLSNRIIYNSSGVVIVRMDNETIIKYGPRVTINEAATLLYLAKHAPAVPVPKLYAAYSCDRTDSPSEGFDSTPPRRIVYLFMQYIEGDNLEDLWPNLDLSSKSTIVEDMGRIVNTFRDIPAPGHIGSVESGPILDRIMHKVEFRGWRSISFHKLGQANIWTGPFDSVSEFHKTLADTYERLRMMNIGAVALRSLDRRLKYAPMFTHTDLKPDNIIIRDNHVVGVISWQRSGFYPEYWEYANVSSSRFVPSDWKDLMLSILVPYINEARLLDWLREVLR